MREVVIDAQAPTAITQPDRPKNWLMLTKALAPPATDSRRSPLGKGRSIDSRWFDFCTFFLIN